MQLKMDLPLNKSCTPHPNRPEQWSDHVKSAKSVFKTSRSCVPLLGERHAVGVGVGLFRLPRPLPRRPRGHSWI